MTELPLYQQIVQALRKQIASGELKSGDQVPTEAELSQQFGVSRITSKRALSELENEGLIYRIRGKGSFVSERELRAASDSTGPGAGAGSGGIGNEVLLMLPFSHNPGLGDYGQGIQERLDASGHTLHIQASSPASQRRLLEHALLGTHQGLIFYPVSNADLDLLYQYALRRYPVVLLDKQLEGLPFPAVVSDNLGGAYEATAHLIARGHRRIAFLSTNEPASFYTERERYWGYLKAMHEHAVPSLEAIELFRLHEADPVAEGEEALLFVRAIRLLQEQGITAIVATNDLTAIECIRAAQSIGLSVPDDLSVIGFDDIQLAEYIAPGLTTMAQDFDRIGYLAAEMLLRQIRNPHLIQPAAVVPVKLVERGSVRTL